MSDTRPLDLSDADAVKRDMAEQFLVWWAIKLRDSDGPAATVAVIRNADTNEAAVEALLGYSREMFAAGVVYATDRTLGMSQIPAGPRSIGKRRRKGRR